MVEPKNLVSRLSGTLSIAFALVGLTVAIVLAIVLYFQRPEVVYFTKEVTTYPVTYQHNRLVPESIQGKVLMGGPVKILELVVRNEGERSASDVLVRIPLSTGDAYLGGWMSESKAPSTVYMLGPGAEYRFHELVPGDAVAFYLYLKNVSTDLAHRVEVFYGDGRRAAYYQYIPVRYVGGDGVVITFRKLWVYLLGLMLAATLLLSISCMRKPKRLALSADRHRRKPKPAAVFADRQSPGGASEHSPTASPGSTGSDEPRPSSETLDGEGAMRSSCSSSGRQDRGLGAGGKS